MRISALERLPAMSDAELATLLVNAERLTVTGSSAQKTAATALLPAIRSEQDSRRLVKAAAKPSRPTRKSGAPKTVEKAATAE